MRVIIAFAVLCLLILAGMLAGTYYGHNMAPLPGAWATPEGRTP